jgi:hypothetical protein
MGHVSFAPRNWDTVVTRNREILQKVSGNTSCLVYDDLMGWTVGPNRRSANRLYFSSVEGIRGPHAEMAFADMPAPHRIVLVGDSFTFVWTLYTRSLGGINSNIL